VIEAERLSILYQPICNVATRRPVGLECLSRFSPSPVRTPDVWFSEAAEVGLGTELELAAISRALRALPALPADIYLAVNASPQTILAEGFSQALHGLVPHRLVLEVTEHAHVDDYAQLLAVIAPLRRRGVRLAVDDAGAGYASLQHILHLQPDIIKLDMGLTRNIDADPARRALASALIGFARETGSSHHRRRRGDRVRARDPQRPRRGIRAGLFSRSPDAAQRSERVGWKWRHDYVACGLGR
jgi:EAL domain-containing protein (putative c-di-GMP-specific phosphodiesterase class I)